MRSYIFYTFRLFNLYCFRHEFTFKNPCHRSAGDGHFLLYERCSRRRFHDFGDRRRRARAAEYLHQAAPGAVHAPDHDRHIRAFSAGHQCSHHPAVHQNRRRFQCRFFLDRDAFQYYPIYYAVRHLQARRRGKIGLQYSNYT